MLRDHGQAQKYYHDMEGYNGRLDSIQAGILRVKLKHLTAWTEMRRAAAARYRELLAGAGDQIRLPYEPAWSKAVYHLFVVRVENRDELMKHLAFGRYRHRNPLSDSAAPSERLYEHGPSTR